MNVLSLFDGMACGEIALERAGFEVENYYASEIDKHAMQVAKNNYPDIRHIGDVRNLTYFNGRLWRGNWDEDSQSVALNIYDAELIHDGHIDLVIGGSPCQSFSQSGKMNGFDDPRGKLFWHFVRLWRQIHSENPKAKFLLENVKMKKAWVQVITEALGVEPIEINSALVSAQNRKRLYWTNIEGVEHPDDKGITLQDIAEDGAPIKACAIRGRYNKDGSTSQRLESSCSNKANALTTVKKDSMACISYRSLVSSFDPDIKYENQNGALYRHFTDTEREVLQTLPVGYTDGAKYRHKMIGNGWTVDVIAHILKYMKDETKANPTDSKPAHPAAGRMLPM